MKKGQSGFTLVELIIVMVILGILAAFALPRFLDRTQSARMAKVQGLYGAMRSAASIAHADLIAGGGTAATTPVTLDGQTIDMTAGYPAGTATGIERAAQVDLNEWTVTTATGTGTATITYAALSTTGTNCKVSYQASTSTTTMTSPTITIGAAGTIVATDC